MPFVRCEKPGHSMLIKMSEMLKKNTDQEMIFLFEKDLAEEKNRSFHCKMLSHAKWVRIYPSQLGVRFISKECQRGLAMSQEHKDGSEILCLVLFPQHHVSPWVDRALGSLLLKEQEDHKVFYKDQLSPSGVGSLLNLLCPGFRSISVLQSYQESPKTEICGD